jgi:TFIIF-interacting CTD phosphatase-like protein
LVHYCEEDDKYFVKIRYGSEAFLQYINGFCEIIIVSTSGVEYSDIIIDNLNINNSFISHKIYTENYHDINLSNINRDMKKTFFICHQDNFLNAPKNNIIVLKEFNGDETDKEFIKLHKEFQNIENNEINDVRNVITTMRNNIMKEIIE